MAHAPLILGFKFAIRISDLGAADYLSMTCRRCNETRRVATWALHSVAPPQMPIQSLEKRMRCTACGHRGDMAWSVWRATPPVREVGDI